MVVSIRLHYTNSIIGIFSFILFRLYLTQLLDGKPTWMLFLYDTRLACWSKKMFVRPLGFPLAILNESRWCLRDPVQITFFPCVWWSWISLTRLK